VATLLSVNVGLPKDVAWQGRTVNTGIWKRSVDGPRMVRRLNVDGDGQGDLNGHGGEQRAVLAYQIDSYRYWQNYFGHNDLEFGQFGENFTVDGLSDDEVCIGDRYRIGDAEFEVTQPRVTCFRVGMRMGQPELPALLVAHRRPGFISSDHRKDLSSGSDQIVRTRVGRHGLSVADVDALLSLPERGIQQLRAAVGILRSAQAGDGPSMNCSTPPGTSLAPVRFAFGVEPGWSASGACGREPRRGQRELTSLYRPQRDGGAAEPRAEQYITPCARSSW
jgi:hypothetical protein